MAFQLGNLSGIPLYDAAQERQNVAQLSVPAPPALAKCNAFAVAQGPEPSHGWVLVRRGDLDQLDLDAPQSLTFISNDPVPGETVNFQNLYIVKEPQVSVPGYIEADPDGVCIVELSDITYLFKTLGPSVNVRYNDRAPAYQGATDDTIYYADSLNAGVHWTWDGMVKDLWQRCGIPAAYPHLPFSPNGVPEGFIFKGVMAYDALNHVLGRLGCAIAREVGPGYTIVQIGQPDPLADPVIGAALEADRLIYDAEFQEIIAGKVPASVTVFFHRRESYGGIEQTAIQTTDQWTNITPFGINVVGPTPGDSVDGLDYPLFDDMPAIYDETGVLTNLAALTARANERANDFYRMLTGFGGQRLWQRFSGLLQVAPGSDLKGIRWVAAGKDGGGAFTEIVRHPYLQVALSETGEWRAAFEEQTKLHAPFLRPTVPNYPPMPQIIKIAGTGTVTPTGGYYDALIEKRQPLAGTWVDKEPIWGLDINADIEEIGGQRFLGRLAGYTNGRPVYAFQGSGTNTTWQCVNGFVQAPGLTICIPCTEPPCTCTSPCSATQNICVTAVVSGVNYFGTFSYSPTQCGWAGLLSVSGDALGGQKCFIGTFNYSPGIGWRLTLFGAAACGFSFGYMFSWGTWDCSGTLTGPAQGAISSVTVAAGKCASGSGGSGGSGSGGSGCVGSNSAQGTMHFTGVTAALGPSTIYSQGTDSWAVGLSGNCDAPFPSILLVQIQCIGGQYYMLFSGGSGALNGVSVPLAVVQTSPLILGSTGLTSYSGPCGTGTFGVTVNFV